MIPSFLCSSEKNILESENEMVEKENDLYYDPKDQKCQELTKEKFGIDSPVYKLLFADLDKIIIEGKKENVTSAKETIKAFREDQISAKIPMDFILNVEDAESITTTTFNKLFQDKEHFNEHSGLLWSLAKAHNTINPLIDYQLIPNIYSFRLQIAADIYRFCKKTTEYIEENKTKFWYDFHNKEMPLIFKNFVETELPKIKNDLDEHIKTITFPTIAEEIEKRLKENTLPIIENKFNKILKEKIIIIDEKIDSVKKDIKEKLHYSLMAGKSLSKLIIFYVALYAVCKKLYYDITRLYQEHILPKEESNRITNKKNKSHSILRKYGIELLNVLAGITLSYLTYQENKTFSHTLEKILS